MNSFLSRGIAGLLVFCLMANPVLAGGFTHAWSAPRSLAASPVSSLFQQEALSATDVESLKQPMLTTDGRERKKIGRTLLFSSLLGFAVLVSAQTPAPQASPEPSMSSLIHSLKKSSDGDEETYFKSALEEQLIHKKGTAREQRAALVLLLDQWSKDEESPDDEMFAKMSDDPRLHALLESISRDTTKNPNIRILASIPWVMAGHDISKLPGALARIADLLPDARITETTRFTAFMYIDDASDLRILAKHPGLARAGVRFLGQQIQRTPLGDNVLDVLSRLDDPKILPALERYQKLAYKQDGGHSAEVRQSADPSEKQASEYAKNYFNVATDAFASVWVMMLIVGMALAGTGAIFEKKKWRNVGISILSGTVCSIVPPLLMVGPYMIALGILIGPLVGLITYNYLMKGNDQDGSGSGGGDGGGRWTKEYQDVFRAVAISA